MTGTPVSIDTQDIDFAYSGNGWRTSGAAGNGDDDLFKISFGPGKETTYEVILEEVMTRTVAKAVPRMMEYRTSILMLTVNIQI